MFPQSHTAREDPAIPFRHELHAAPPHAGGASRPCERHSIFECSAGRRGAAAAWHGKGARRVRNVAIQVRRFLIYLVGMVVLAFGIVLCAQCNLGTTPISSIPYVMTRFTPLTFGALTSLHHFANIAVQYALDRKLWNPRVLLQLPECLLFGALVDAVGTLVPYSPTAFPAMVALMVASIFLIAAGTVLMVSMNLIPNPPDGCVRLITEKVHGDMGVVKRFYDITMVAVAAVLDLVLFQDLYGLGIASLVSMFCVGKLISMLQKRFGHTLIALREGDDPHAAKEGSGSEGENGRQPEDAEGKRAQ